MFGLFSKSNVSRDGGGAPLRQLIRDGALLVDVRTPQEFASGHVNGSVNIPLNRLATELDRLRGNEHIVVFCLSGNRSHQARMLLERQGFTNVHDGGTWRRVQELAED